MSYMNDDTDPFGLPYTTTVKCPNFKSKEKEYSFEDLTNLHEEQRKVQTKLSDIKAEKKEAIEYLTEKLRKLVEENEQLRQELKTICNTCCFDYEGVESNE